MFNSCDSGKSGGLHYYSCDSGCGARAKILITLPSFRCLYFCFHHYQAHRDAILAAGCMTEPI